MWVIAPETRPLVDIAKIPASQVIERVAPFDGVIIALPSLDEVHLLREAVGCGAKAREKRERERARAKDAMLESGRFHALPRGIHYPSVGLKTVQSWLIACQRGASLRAARRSSSGNVA